MKYTPSNLNKSKDSTNVYLFFCLLRRQSLSYPALSFNLPSVGRKLHFFFFVGGMLFFNHIERLKEMKKSSVQVLDSKASWRLLCIRSVSGVPRFRVVSFAANGGQQSWLFDCPLSAWAFFGVASRRWRTPVFVPFKHRVSKKWHLAVQKSFFN